MERFCIVALTFFNLKFIILSILLFIFVLGNSSAQQKYFFMEEFKVEILNPLSKEFICSVLVESINLIDVIRSFCRSGYLVQVHPTNSPNNY